MEVQEIQAGQFYRHFKGNLYKVICIATDSETNEKVIIDHGAVTANAALSAILRVTANSEPPGDYPLWGRGLFADQVFNIENKENITNLIHIALKDLS